jgi:hypothetical protein
MPLETTPAFHPIQEPLLKKTGNTAVHQDSVAGAYTINVTDSATGCTVTAAITIAQPFTAL